MAELFEHIDSQIFFDECYQLLMAEADRGCILLGVSMLDAQLKSLFERIIPAEASNKKKKEIFDGKGTFGTLSAKLDIAYVCHLLPPNLIECIHKLRKLRNDLAHQAAPFTIKDNLEPIYEVFTLLKGNVTAGLAQISGEIIYGSFFKKLMEADHPIKEDKKLFESEKEAYSYMSKNSHLLEGLTEQRIKCMFVIGVSILAATIIHHREKAIRNFIGKA